MARAAAQYVCQDCGAAHRKWTGRCDDCGAWNSVIEEAPAEAPVELSGHQITVRDGKVVALDP